MTFRTAKLAGALFAALTIAAPLALTASADAAPHGQMGGGGMMGGGAHRDNHPDSMHDRDHRPPQRAERRPHQPRGHYRWRNGAWNWSHNQWTWAPGIWIRF